MDRRVLSAVIIVSSAILVSACQQPKSEKPLVTSKDELILYLDTLEQRYETACAIVGLANWNSYSKEAAYDLKAAKAELAKIFLDTTAQRIVEEWHDRSGSLADKLLARRLELWRRCFIGARIYADAAVAEMENNLQQKITDFTFTYNGAPTTRAKVSNTIRQEKKQSERNKLWQVTNQLSAVAHDDLIKLVKVRNEKAREFGYPSYYSLSLSLHAIDEEWLVRTLNYLEEKTRPMFEEFIAASKKKFRIKEFGPWDFDYTLVQSTSLPDKYFPPDSVFRVIHKFQKGIGFNVDSLPIKEVVKDIPYGGLSLAITIPGDSRFLVNPTKGKGFYATAFHEYGHSLKAVLTNVRYPIFKGYEWLPGAQCSAYEEGVADMHGEFTEDSLWLSTFTKTKAKEIDRYIKDRGLPTLYRLRRLLKDFFIEYEMYKNPGQNMAELEHAMFKKYLLVDLDSTEKHQFAASIWYTSYPCYYQNYILAGMIATQLQEALSNKFGEEKISDPRVAQWMSTHLYESGETLEWNERIRNATGKSLEPGAYLRKIGVEQMKVITKEEEPENGDR